MSVNAILDITIGLVLMYMLLSLICTIINEFIASVTKLRASNLQRSIHQLIDDPNLRTALEKAPLIVAVNSVSGGKGPSYLPARTFALALLDALKQDRGVAKLESVKDVIRAIEKLPKSNVKGALLCLSEGALEDVEDFQRKLATWFDDMMDRAAGVYKRKLQYRSLLVGLFLAVAVNADTISVSQTLWTDGTLRAQLAQVAERFVEKTEYVEDLRDLAVIQFELRPFPIGWDFAAPTSRSEWYVSFGGILVKILGLLLTAAAVSLGAPFWFDVLSKFTKIRSSGAVPKREEHE